MTPSQTEARRRILLALSRIEHAQNELNAACSDISSILGLVREWERLGKLADSVNAYWHRLNDLSDGGFDLDEMARARFK